MILLGYIGCAAFLMQASWVHAEDSFLPVCDHHHSDHQDEECPCGICHLHCGVFAMHAEQDHFVIFCPFTMPFFPTPFRGPDGALREIDHPPQLLS